jgi:hypothetical protein
MSKQMIVVDSAKGVESVETVVSSVSDGIAAGVLAAKTALPLRLLHESAKDAGVEGTAVPVDYLDSILGTFVFRCACGRQFRGPWEDARYEAIGHVELHHASTTVKKDLDGLEDVIEALILPSPLYSWQELQEEGK